METEKCKNQQIMQEGMLEGHACSHVVCLEVQMQHHSRNTVLL